MDILLAQMINNHHEANCIAFFCKSVKSIGYKKEVLMLISFLNYQYLLVNRHSVLNRHSAGLIILVIASCSNVYLSPGQKLHSFVITLNKRIYWIHHNPIKNAHTSWLLVYLFCFVFVFRVMNSLLWALYSFAKYI